MKFYMARCNHCDLDLPFGDEEVRDAYVRSHEQADHTPAGFDGPAIVTVWNEER